MLLPPCGEMCEMWLCEGAASAFLILVSHKVRRYRDCGTQCLGKRFLDALASLVVTLSVSDYCFQITGRGDYWRCERIFELCELVFFLYSQLRGGYLSFISFIVFMFLFCVISFFSFKLSFQTFLFKQIQLLPEKLKKWGKILLCHSFHW